MKKRVFLLLFTISISLTLNSQISKDYQYYYVIDHGLELNSYICEYDTNNINKEIEVRTVDDKFGHRICCGMAFHIVYSNGDTTNLQIGLFDEFIKFRPKSEISYFYTGNNYGIKNIFYNFGQKSLSKIIIIFREDPYNNRIIYSKRRLTYRELFDIKNCLRDETLDKYILTRKGIITPPMIEY